MTLQSEMTGHELGYEFVLHFFVIQTPGSLISLSEQRSLLLVKLSSV